MYKLSFIFCFIFSLCLFACGLANYNSTDSGAASFQESRDGADESTGVFNSPAGRLESEDVCSDNDDCVELCDSMLNRLSYQKKCYDKKEAEVQAFRDVYNLLAIGNPRKLERVDTEQMEEFLVFGPELWKDAITGFERGRKEDCVENLDPPDPRDREDCQFDNYYKQEGYWSSSAAAALEWIAGSNWLSEFIQQNDEDHIIMKTLLNILAHGGEEELREEGGNSPVVNPEDGPFKNSFCLIESALTQAPPDISLKLEDQYRAFGSNCLENISSTYFSVAVRKENDHSVRLGHQVLKDLCESGLSCIKRFYCRISDNNLDVDGYSARNTTSGAVLNYVKYLRVNGWGDYDNCSY